MLLQVIINGILKGGLYALMALGMSLIWGVMDIINIAHGAFIMLGAYTSYWLFELMGMDPFVSLVFSMGIMFFIGYAIQKNLINLVIRAEILTTLLLAFGIEIFIINAALILWTADVRKVKVAYAAANFEFMGATIPYVRLAAFALAIIISIILFIVLNKTRLGRAIRATSQDIEAAKLAGVKVSNIYAITYAIGTSLAAAAGTLWAILFPVNPIMGGHLTLKSFVVTIVGGLGTMLGPLIGGLTLGVVEAIGTNWFGSTYENLISFTILVLVLIFMPKGILGGKAQR
ncbi:branched-chain amino acid ABC transporter permease [Desulfohalobiaceae bacterium Ax17]|jgi:branched-chain amino acid transport system permease protein|uniref:branched-chain amino acid ABC transporter permease n=1 Tax=Desulfovulcanus ferrireducens TaxID=2831190 RepID=UPI00207BB53D|nr:branched-chain amino acid ABC transporter permease [Desulfovulcanus ferrireducens]MBT8763905.1 branched-chain amino acid ABC transporter permease [Desulfovulcanus ferrireducens]